MKTTKLWKDNDNFEDVCYNKHDHKMYEILNTKLFKLTGVAFLYKYVILANELVY